MRTSLTHGEHATSTARARGEHTSSMPCTHREHIKKRVPYTIAPKVRATRRIRRLQHDIRRHAIQFAGMLPRGMSAAALRALLLQRAQAAHARNRLDAPPV